MPLCIFSCLFFAFVMPCSVLTQNSFVCFGLELLRESLLTWGVLYAYHAIELTIAVHILLKLGIGALFRSAGLIADGIDKTADTLSSVFVWLGIAYDREKKFLLM